MNNPIVTANVKHHYSKIQRRYIWEDVEVEILAINFNTQSVKVRFETEMFEGKGIKKRTETISIKAVKTAFGFQFPGE